MPDYQKLYAILFRSQTKAITILMEAQRETENIYIESEPPDIKILPTREDKDTDAEDGEKE